ncbi:MAG: hypothetical protein ACK4GM_13475 [Tabrizicola sp.]
MHKLSALILSMTLALPAAAQTVLSEASGNWAGSSNQGFFFLARLTQNEDKLRLTIWNGAMEGVPSPNAEPEFDNPGIALGAFATRQALEVLDRPGGAILQVVVEFADEEAEGRTVTQLQFIDNQYTVVGYYHRSTLDNPGGAPETWECEVDLWKMTGTENGTTRQLEPVGFEALNASGWTWDAAFDRGFCTRAD